MNRQKQIVGMCLFLVLLLLVACSPKVVPTPEFKAPASAPAAASKAPALAVPAKPAWEVEWEKVLAAAKQEGRVIIFTGGGGADRRAALTNMAKLGGITAEVTSARIPEFMVKIFAERRAGLYLWDIYFGGYPPDLLAQGKPDGFLERLDPLLILPDLTDPERIKKVWFQGEFPWVDKNHTLFILSLVPRIAIGINTNLVKPEEITSYRDLLNPKWRGKVVINDPTISGAGQLAVQAMIGLVGEDFVREFAATKPIVLRDQRQQVEWLAQGKVPLVVAAEHDIWIEFAKVGATIKVVIPKEGTFASSAGSGVTMIKNALHPNAARAFVNLAASKEGEEIHSRTVFHHSLRLDVPTTHLPPEAVRVEGVKYYDTWSEEFTLVRRPPAEKLAKDLFGPLTQK